MAVSFIDQEPRIVPVVFSVPYTTFSAVSTSVLIAGSGVGPGVIPTTARIVDVIVHKETAFDTNTVEFGHLTTAGNRDTLATAAEVAATTKGVVRAVGWMGTDKFGDLLTTANRGLYARLGAGSLPTAGLIRLTVMLQYLTPRASI